MNRNPAETLDDLVRRGLGLDPRDLNMVLKAVWQLMHGPLFRHGAATLVTLFMRAGYVSDGGAYPAGDLTVYRGEPVASEEQGVSWTTDFQVVRTYARGYSTTGPVQVL